MLRAIRLNARNGALVKYRKPEKAWLELIKNWYKNGKVCDVKHFTKYDCNIDDDDDEEEDFEMNDNKLSYLNKKKKRPIRLHPSYTGFTKNNFITNEDLKDIANKCYVSTAKSITNNDNNNNDSSMDCD